MPSTVLDGPAAGVGFSLRRAPTYLRLVRDRESGKWDALDQPEDEPRDTEDVFAYRIEPGTWSFVFVRPGGRYEYGRYRHLPEAPAEVLRSRPLWLTWATLWHADTVLDQGPGAPAEVLADLSGLELDVVARLLPEVPGARELAPDRWTLHAAD